MQGNSKLSERLALITLINPTSLTTASTVATSTLVSLAATTANTFERLLVLAQSAGTNTQTINVIANTANSATSATVLKTASLTANGVVVVDFNVPQHYYSSSPFVGVQITSSATAVVSAVILGGDAKYEPVADYNASGVATPINAA